MTNAKKTSAIAHITRRISDILSAITTHYFKEFKRSLEPNSKFSSYHTSVVQK